MSALTDPPQRADLRCRGPDRRPRGRPRIALSLALSALALAPTASPTHAQNAIDTRPDTTPPLFARADAILAATLISSLAFIDPLERLDRNLSDIASRDADPGAGIYRMGEAFGRNRTSLALASAPLAWGLIVGDPTARRLGLHALESLFATSFVTGVIKQGVGRTRPLCGSDSDGFAPFSSDACHHSFPSGHTARAFALATTFSLELGETAPWIPWVSYTLATWTALTRVRDRAHWPTDVLGGAALGVLTARLVHRLNYSEGREAPILIALSTAPDGGLEVSASLAAP
ncbi:MAG: phosphatase PAP2 family protein [Gemmatimonadetes bacterium]|uniref:Phosphatase PAP2 family protein n=1 Tax=Candidatus Kutchimonas denitrificans TaxID=3056748 RepID=A0AAE4ZAC2_9BACT|nr:phosphatase PAP2 family protein [Gemmatimonadota bacterium]NIR76523.1 phosphatase PAP2 family protein [Candidatus Kutchimonas denitrificans]NIS03341.1 phosphatase PAP2 family protein [Gemmatimonadota bacterium]NIT69202.1 phosphatase PAP2 family protein [Gemmatimonadota bacterium]NIU54594.1 phosphatase PAP2 family protein [Gemmatimonadota bacterium]